MSVTHDAKQLHQMRIAALMQAGRECIGPDATPLEALLGGALLDLKTMLAPGVQVSIVVGPADGDNVLHVGQLGTTELVARLQLTMMQHPERRTE